MKGLSQPACATKQKATSFISYVSGGSIIEEEENEGVGNGGMSLINKSALVKSILVVL